MQEIYNPYTPGAGSRPRALAGRDEELRRFELLLERLDSGRNDRSMIVQGLRGVGKTVLMGEFEDRARDRNWGVGRTEIRTDTDFREELSSMARSALRQISTGERAKAALLRAAKFIQAFSLKATPGGEIEVTFDLEAALADPVGSDIERDAVALLVEVGMAARECDSGIVFLIDEMHLLGRRQLEALCAAAHRVSQDLLPVAIVGAGLPVLPAKLAEAKSYAERLFTYPMLGPLSYESAAVALESPAATAIEGLPVTFEPAAVDAILEHSDRYPYFIQEYGLHSWNSAPEGNLITLAAVEAAFGPAREELDRDFFETRYARATKAGRRYMSAMADLGDGPQPTGSVAERGGWKSSTSAGPVRQGLVDKGMIYASDRGEVDFTVPHFGDFMRRRHPLAASGG